MRNVSFDNKSNSFRCISETSEVEYSFNYYPSTEHLWKDIREEDFNVDLLINPYLNRESNIYSLESNSERVGYIFPIAVLDSSEDLEDYGCIYNYIFIAYKILLKRLPIITNSTDFTENFEDNVIVCIFNLRHTPDNPLSKCIHSLRKLGYSYFEDNNHYKAITHYDSNFFIDSHKGKIRVDFRIPKLYGKPIVDYLLREYSKVSNTTHRFVILYQIIEFLMDDIAEFKISETINKYKLRQIPQHDLFNNFKELSYEKKKLKSIFSLCKISDSDFDSFKSNYTILCNCIGYYPANKDDRAEYFYSFRNQMTHSYREIHGHEKELDKTVQAFELLVLTIVERYELDNNVNVG